MKLFLLSVCTLFVVTACESRLINTSQPMKIDLIGTDEAFCILSTKYNRYSVNAPDTLVVERSDQDLKIDCKGNAGRRRVVTIVPEFADLYYRYPEKVTIDFSTMENGDRYNGFRARTQTQSREFNAVINTVMTEESFSSPVETPQAYPVKRDYVMGRRSYPVAAE